MLRDVIFIRRSKAILDKVLLYISLAIFFKALVLSTSNSMLSNKNLQ